MGTPGVVSYQVERTLPLSLSAFEINWHFSMHRFSIPLDCSIQLDFSLADLTWICWSLSAIYLTCLMVPKNDSSNFFQFP